MEISDRLTKIAVFYNKEAHKCAKARAYLAATAMQMAALEATLQAMCFLFPEEVKKTTVYLQKKRFNGKRYKALEFTLYQLINIAKELSWFPPKRTTWAGKRTDLAGFTQAARDLRNFVHPGKWSRERSRFTKFRKGTFDAVEEIHDVAHSWLMHHLNKNLLIAIEREEKKKKGTMEGTC